MGKLNKSFRAYILYVSLTDDGSRRSCIPLLTDHYYHIADDRNGSCVGLRKDIVIIDARSVKTVTENHFARIDGLKHQHPEASLMVVTDIAAPYGLRQSLKQYGIVCAIGQEPELLLPRLERLLENLALADECGERLKTLSSLNKSFEAQTSLRPSSADMRVLVAGTPSPLSLRTFSSLKKAGFKVTAAISVPQTIRYLENGSFDSLVMLPGNKAAVYSSLIKLLRRNDKTRTLPVLVLSEELTETSDEAGYRYLTQGADLVLAGRDEEEAIMSEVKAFAKRNRLTKSMRQFLRKSVMPDRSTKSLACDLPFFETHLARQCSSSKMSGRHLCLSVFQLKTVRDHPPSPTVCRQAVSYAEMMIQDTDLMTVVRNDLILISQPGKAIIDANKTRKRIVSLLQELKFKTALATDAYEDLSIASSTVLYGLEEKPEEMITRALKTLTELPRPVTKKPRPLLTLVQ